MSRGGAFVALSLAAIVVIAGLLSLVFTGPGDRHAIVVSAVLAFVLQLLLFAVVRSAAPRKLMTMWGVGALVRVVTRGIYGLLMVRAFHLAPAAALVSIASFFFVTTIIESWLLVK